MRVVLDTNTLVSAWLWRGTPFRLLQTLIEQQSELVTSPALLAELEEILQRPRFAARLAERRTSVEELIGLYRAVAMQVSPLSTPRVVTTDADDDHVIACALAGQAELIVSGDRDLLTLHPFRHIQILNAADALRMIQERTLT